MGNQITLDFKSPIIFYGIIIYLLSLIVDGPIRYVLHFGGADFLIYFRDLILLSILMIYLLKVLISGRIHKIILMTFFIIFFHAIIGFLLIGNVFQVAFGLKILVPLAVGMLAYPVFASRPRAIKYIFLLFFIIAVLGVFLNYFKEFPWEGMKYQVGGQEVEGGRSWTMFGIKRVAGFSRSSFDVSVQLMIVSIFLITYIERKLIAIPLWLLAGLAIMATTTKGMVLTYIILSMFLIVYKIIPNFLNYYQKLLIVPILITILLPVFAYTVFTAGFYANFNTLWLMSFVERMADIWPFSFDLFLKKGYLLLGRGIGGLGTSQFYFENKLYTPGDNFFVYAFGYFGVLSIVYFLYIYRLAQNIDLKNFKLPSGLFNYLILLTIFTYGIISNVVENPFFMISLGLCLRYIWIESSENKMNYCYQR